jgi:hypothetical protein
MPAAAESAHMDDRVREHADVLVDWSALHAASETDPPSNVRTSTFMGVSSPARGINARAAEGLLDRLWTVSPRRSIL